MQHPILGQIITSDSRPFDAIATIRHNSRSIKIGITHDDQPLDTTINLAAEVVRRLAELETLAKQIAVKDLLETYNNNWNEYDEAQDDGSWKTVSNPKLSESEFAAKLSLNAINITGDQMIDFFYDNSGMFDGHSIIVTSLHGLDFTKARAELFG